MSIELLASESYIKAALLQGGNLPAGVKVFAGVVPEGQPLPAVLMSRQSAMDTNGGGGERLLTQPVYFIRGVVDSTCLEALAPMAYAIDQAFRITADTPPSVVNGVIVRGAQREQPMIGDTVELGITYSFAGGLYRLFTYLPDGGGSGTVLSLPPSVSVQSQLDALTQKVDDFIMAYEPNASTGILPKVPITATVTLALPASDTRYPVNITANTVITLPAADGSGKKLAFDFDSLGAFTCTFALNGSDTYITPLPPIVTGASFALVTNAAGKWSIE